MLDQRAVTHQIILQQAENYLLWFNNVIIREYSDRKGREKSWPEFHFSSVS